MGNLANIEFRLSGGATGVTNVDPSDSIGTVMSTAVGGEVLSQAASALTTLTGVTINNASGNALGAGSLIFTATGQTLKWQDAGGTIGEAVDVSVSGVYSIQAGGGGYLDVTVVIGTLPGTNTTNAVTITLQDNKVFDDVAKADSLAGDIEYRCLFVKNAHASDSIVGVKLWVENNTPGQDTVQIALDTTGKGTAALVIANEDVAPVGVDFDAANPISEATGLDIGTLAFGESYPFWIRRTVPAATDVATVDDTFRLGIAGSF